MESQPILILPGYHGSGPTHWQSWLQHKLPHSQRLSGVDWERPVLDLWVEAAKRCIQTQSPPVWLVAHSFGCLTALTAAAELPGRIAGALLVAPADPERFTPVGARDALGWEDGPSLASTIPAAHLPFPTLVVASCNDPWMQIDTVRQWAERWGSGLIEIGAAGHINVDSGFGPWPQSLALLAALQSGRFPTPGQRARPLRPAAAFPSGRHSQVPRRTQCASFGGLPLSASQSASEEHACGGFDLIAASWETL